MFGWLGCGTSGCFLADLLLGGVTGNWGGDGALMFPRYQPRLLRQKAPQPCLVEGDGQGPAQRLLPRDAGTRVSPAVDDLCLTVYLAREREREMSVFAEAVQRNSKAATAQSLNA